MAEFTEYRRTQTAEMTPWTPEIDMSRVSLTEADRDAGSPKVGDMVARNPQNHDDRWLVAAKYYGDNFEPMAANKTLTFVQGADWVWVEDEDGDRLWEEESWASIDQFLQFYVDDMDPVVLAYRTDEPEEDE